MAKNGKALSGVISGAATGTAISPGYGTAIGAGAGLLGGLLGDQGDSANEDAIAKQRAANLAMYNNIAVPELDVDYQHLSNGVMIDPRLGTAEQLGSRDALQDINLDPRLAQAKRNSLDTLSKIAGAGFTPDELNAMQQQRSAREADTTAKMKQIQQNMDMRGAGNSDLNQAQQMMEAQSSANRGGADARDMQAQAFKRSLQAITDSGNLANNYENTDYTRQSNLAQAQNSRELTNLGQRATMQNNNLDRFNNALASNVGRQNSVLDKNVAINNSMQDEKNRLAQGKFSNQITKANGQSGANTADMGLAQKGIDSSNAMWGGIASGAMQLGAAYGKNNKTSPKAAASTESDDKDDAYADARRGGYY
jgi:hypothetical protein